jgi:hypothetical protein
VHGSQLFAIVGAQRSGTIGLGAALDGHPDIQVWGEVFLDTARSDKKFFDSPLESENFFTHWANKIIQDRDAIFPRWATWAPFLDDYFETLRRRSNGSSLGYQLKYDQVDYVPNLTHWMRSRRVKVIHMRRRSLVRTILSQLNLIHRIGAGLSTHTKTEAPPEPEISFLLPDERTLRAQVEDLRRRSAEIAYRLEGLPTLVVWYEDLYGQEGPNVLVDVQRFLGVAPMALAFQTRKSSPVELESAFSASSDRELVKSLLAEEQRQAESNAN